MEPSKSKKGILNHLRIIVSNITGKPTVNGTKYTRQLWDHILADDTVKMLLKNKTMFGELDHPRDDETLETSLSKSAVAFTSLEIEGDEVMGEMDILDTPSGRIVQSLIDAGCNIGLSLRGQGTVGYDGTVSHQGYRLHGIDVVSNPSYQSSRLVGSINESVKATKTNEQVLLESAQKEINIASSPDELAKISNVIETLPINEAEKDSMLSDINLKISDYESGDTTELTEYEMQEAVLESVLKEVNVLQKQVTKLEAEKNEFQQSYNDLVSNRLQESAQFEKDNVVVSKQDLVELKEYAKLLESKNEELSTTLDATVSRHDTYRLDKEKELVSLKEEVTSLGVKVGVLDSLKTENSKLKNTVKELKQESDSLNGAYERLLKQYSSSVQSTTGITVNESFKTVEEFDRLFESASKRNAVLNSSRPKNSFHSVIFDDMNIVESSTMSKEDEAFVNMAKRFIPEGEK